MRAAPTLAANLRAALTGGSPSPHVPDPRYLALVSTGRKHAVVFSARLLMVLMYLRWNVSYRALGGLLGVSKDAVLRSMELRPEDELLVLLDNVRQVRELMEGRLVGEPEA